MNIHESRHLSRYGCRGVVGAEIGHLMAHDSTAVIAAAILLQHGLADDVVVRYVARRPLNERESAAVLTAAHELLDKSPPRPAPTRPSG